MYFSQDFCSLCLKKDSTLDEINKTSDCFSYYFKLSVLVPEMRCNEMKNGLICGLCRKKVNDMYGFRNMCLRNKSVNSQYISRQSSGTVVDNVQPDENNCAKKVGTKDHFVSANIFNDQIKCEPLDIKVEEDFEYVDVTMDPLREPIIGSIVESLEPHNYSKNNIGKPQKYKRTYRRRNTKMAHLKRQKNLETQNDTQPTIDPLTFKKPDGQTEEIDIENFLAMHMVPQSDPVVIRKSYISKFKIRNVMSLSEENEQEPPTVNKRVPDVVTPVKEPITNIQGTVIPGVIAKVFTAPTDRPITKSINGDTYNCNMCKWKSYSLHAYNKHISKHNSLAYNNFILETHKTKHSLPKIDSAEDPSKWKKIRCQPMNLFTDRVTCQICNMTLPNTTVLNAHHELLHTPYVNCPVCSKSFHSVQAMTNHSKLNHDESDKKNS